MGVVALAGWGLQLSWGLVTLVGEDQNVDRHKCHWLQAVCFTWQLLCEIEFVTLGSFVVCVEK